METQNLLMAFGLTIIAGLSTGIGGIISLFAKRDNVKFLTLTLGFSAGVMLFVSFVDILPSALALFDKATENNPMLLTMISFFAGIALIALIDFMIPEKDNPHEMNQLNDIPTGQKMQRMGIMLAVSIAIHNFPEGLATFAVSLNGIQVALPIVIAIALHNIPEGMTVSIPIYQATGSRKKAMVCAFLSGLAEPLGALIGFLVLLPFWNEVIEASLLAATAGIMVYISLDELLPTSEKYGRHHLSIIGVVAGMVIMAASLILFA